MHRTEPGNIRWWRNILLKMIPTNCYCSKTVLFKATLPSKSILSWFSVGKADLFYPLQSQPILHSPIDTFWLQNSSMIGRMYLIKTTIRVMCNLAWNLLGNRLHYYNTIIILVYDGYKYTIILSQWNTLVQCKINCQNVTSTVGSPKLQLRSESCSLNEVVIKRDLMLYSMSTIWHSWLQSLIIS